MKQLLPASPGFCLLLPPRSPRALPPPRSPRPHRESVPRSPAPHPVLSATPPGAFPHTGHRSLLSASCFHSASFPTSTYLCEDLANVGHTSWAAWKPTVESRLNGQPVPGRRIPSPAVRGELSPHQVWGSCWVWTLESGLFPFVLCFHGCVV